MANEATLLKETALPVSFTVAEGAGIEKGAILKLTDPMTAALADGDEDDVAGIAAEEKIASNGQTKLAVYRQGEFKVTASGSITAGDTVATHASSGGSNVVAVATASAVGGKTLGIALETVSEGETFRMELRPGCNNQAYS